MPWPLVVAGVLAGISAISGIVKRSQEGKTIEVEEDSYNPQTYGDPRQVGTASGIYGGFNTDVLTSKYTRADPGAQRWATAMGYTQALSGAGSSIFGSFAGSGGAMGGVNREVGPVSRVQSAGPSAESGISIPKRAEEGTYVPGISSPGTPQEITNLNFDELFRQDAMTGDAFKPDLYAEGGANIKGGRSTQVVDIKKIKGRSHEGGGVPMKVNGKDIEAEGGEYELTFKDGSKAILNKEQMRAYQAGVPIDKILQTLPVA